MPSRTMMKEMFSHYAPREADVHNPLVCPLNSEDLAGLPPALILTAEKDLLRDEAEEYALKLQAAGCEAWLSTANYIYGSLLHAGYKVCLLVSMRRSFAAVQPCLVPCC